MPFLRNQQPATSDPPLARFVQFATPMTSSSFERATRDAAPWVEGLARLGYASKAAVYFVVGGLTAFSALHHHRNAADRQDAFAFIERLPFGRALLLLLAIGLLGYAVWRISSAIADSERRGTDAKGIALRIGSFVRGAAYGWIAIEVARLAMRHAGGGHGSDANARHWTAKAMDAPFGRAAVAIAGAIIVGYGVYQLSVAWTAKLSKQLHAGAAHPWVLLVSRFGIGARGVVFGIVGGSLVVAALHRNPAAARGTTGALRKLAEQPYGHVLLLAAAIGLAAYGVYALLNARYRTIRAV
jgi:hypothetical protein